MANSPADELIDAVGVSNNPTIPGTASDPASQLIQAVQQPDTNTVAPANQNAAPSNEDGGNKDNLTLGQAVSEFGIRAANAGKGMGQGFNIVMNRLDPFRYISSTVKEHQNQLERENAAANNNPQFNKAIPIGEMATAMPVLLGLNTAVGMIPEVGQFLAGAGGENLLTKGISAASGGAISGGAYNQLTGNDPMQGAEIGAMLGPVARMAGGIVNPATPEVPPLSSDDIKGFATQAYKTATDKGGVLSPAFTNNFLDEIQTNPKIMAQTVKGQTLEGESPVSQIVNTMKAFKDQPLTLPEAQEIDEFLGKKMDSMTDMGRLNKEGQQLLQVQQILRDSIDKASPSDIIGGKDGFDALNQGRQLWAGAARMRDVERIMSRAESADNPAIIAKNGFRALYNNPARMRGFNDEEAALIKSAGQTGLGVDALRIAGSRLIPMISAATEGVTGGLGGLAASTLARNAASSMQLAKGTEVLKGVAQRATAGNSLLQQTPAPVSTYINKLIGQAIPAYGAQSLAQ